MKKFAVLMALVGSFFLVLPCQGQQDTGAYTTNNWFYKPGLGDYGTASLTKYNNALDASDAEIEKIAGKVDASDWTSINNYPSACGSGYWVQAIGDSLTCTLVNIALGSQTTGNYVGGVTTGGGLTMTGTEGATVGLTPCAENQIPKYVSGAWTCSADSTGGSPSFDTVASGTNVTATMTVGTGATIVATGSGAITATDLSCTNCIGDTEITTDAGTSLAADLEEETHTSEHAVSGGDSVYPADPNADGFLVWDDNPGTLEWGAVGTGLSYDGSSMSVTDLSCTNCIDDTEITTNAGTALSDDLEEEAHASEHAVGGGDATFPADPGVNGMLTWDDTNSTLEWGALGDLSYTGTSYLVNSIYDSTSGDDGYTKHIGLGTLTSSKLCAYNNSTGMIDCNTDQGSGGAAGDTGDIQYNNLDSLAAITDINSDGTGLTFEDSGLLMFGTANDWLMEWDDADNVMLKLRTAATSAGNPQDDEIGMFTIAADTNNSPINTDQEVFEVGKGGEDDDDTYYTELFAVDAEGDTTIAGNLNAVGASSIVKIGSGSTGAVWDKADTVTAQSVYTGAVSLEQTTTTGGASIVGAYDEFTNSNSTNVQDVLDDIDNVMMVTNGSNSMTGDLSLGADPAEGGAIRLSNSGYIKSEASPAGTDVDMMYVSAAGNLVIGDYDNATNAYIYSDGNIYLDAQNDAANSTVAVQNSATTYVANLTVDGSITAASTVTAAGVNSSATINSTAGGLATSNSLSCAGYITITENSTYGNNTLTLQGPANIPVSPGNIVLTLPNNDGDANNVLSTDGSGNLSWVAPSAGTGDVTSVGGTDANGCTGGDCLDGTTDGGTQIALYDGNSNKVTIDTANLSLDRTIILPDSNETVGTATLVALDENSDFGDFDVTSVDRLEGVNSAMYIDMGADADGIQIVDDTKIVMNDGASTVTVDGGITVSTGDFVTVGTTRWDDGSDQIDIDASVNDSTDDNFLDVAAGGTGVGTHTDDYLLVGNGTGDVLTASDNGEYINVGTNSTFAFTTGTAAETPLITSADTDATANLTIAAGGNSTLTLGDSGDTVNVASSTWNVTDGAMSGLTSIAMTASTAPSITLTDSDTGTAGTAAIKGLSAGTQDVTMSFYVEDAGGETGTEYMQIDGASETVDLLKPLTGTSADFSGDVAAGTVTVDAVNNPYLKLDDNDSTDWYMGVDDTGNSVELRTNASVNNSVMLEITETGNMTLTGNSMTMGAANDPYIQLSDSDSTDWFVGVDDAGNSLEFRTNYATGNSVMLEVSESTGNTVVTGDLTITGNDLTFGNGEGIDNNTNGTLDLNATTVNLGSAALVATGTISGAIPSITKSGDYTLGTDSSQEAYGYMVWLTGDGTVLTLPAVVAGMSVCVYSADSYDKVVDPNASDGIRNGTTTRNADGHKITSGATDQGSFVCLMADGADGWTVLGKAGTWTDE